MKSTLFLLIILLAAIISARAQTVTLYGYVQKVVPGNTAARELSEDGSQKKVTTEAGQDYFLYLAGPAKSRIYLMEGWLKGERVGLRSKAIATPVTFPSSLPVDEPAELVPKKQGTVWQLTTEVATASTKASQRGKVLSAANDVVVVYRMNGKIGYATLKSLKELPASYRQ
jgi:hypothetical protein